MAFSFNDLTQKAKAAVSTATDKTKDAAELVKINVAIAGEQKEIDKSYRAIGEWFVNEYQGEVPEALQALLEAVNTAKAKIAELEASKPVKEEAPAAEEPAAPEVELKTCPICGAKADSKFCPQCGAPMGE